MSVAVDVISKFLFEHDMMVYLVVFGHTEFLTGKKLFRDIQEYIDDVYAEKHILRRIPKEPVFQVIHTLSSLPQIFDDACILQKEKREHQETALSESLLSTSFAAWI